MIITFFVVANFCFPAVVAVVVCCILVSVLFVGNCFCVFCWRENFWIIIQLNIRMHNCGITSPSLWQLARMLACKTSETFKNSHQNVGESFNLRANISIKWQNFALVICHLLSFCSLLLLLLLLLCRSAMFCPLLPLSLDVCYKSTCVYSFSNFASGQSLSSTTVILLAAPATPIHLYIRMLLWRMLLIRLVI